MKVGIMTNHFVRQSLDETLDAIISHDIFHVQFNLASAHMKGSLDHEIDLVGNQVSQQITKRNMSISALSGEINMVHPDLALRQAEITHFVG